MTAKSPSEKLAFEKTSQQVISEKADRQSIELNDGETPSNTDSDARLLSYGFHTEDETGMGIRECSVVPPIKRKNTDSVWMVLLLCSVLIAGVVVFISLMSGVQRRVLYGADTWGNICGDWQPAIEGIELSGLDVREKTHLFTIKHSGRVGDDFSPKICVRRCPHVSIDSLEELRSYADVYKTYLCRYDVNASFYDGHEQPDDETLRVKCPSFPIPAHKSIGRQCLPLPIYSYRDVYGTSLLNPDHEVLESGVKKTIGSVTQALCEQIAYTRPKMLNDIIESWKYILYSGFASIGVSLVMTCFVALCASTAIYTAVIASILGTVTVSLCCWFSYFHYKKTLMTIPQHLQVHSDYTIVNRHLVFACLTTIVVVKVIVVSLSIRTYIPKAIRLQREVNVAMAMMPNIVLQPFLTLTIFGCVTAGSVHVLLYIGSLGQNVLSEHAGVYFLPDTAVIFMILIFLVATSWFLTFVLECQCLVIFGAYTTWYFTRVKSTVVYPILFATWRTLRYHLGTAAFGAVIPPVSYNLRLLSGVYQNKPIQAYSKGSARSFKESCHIRFVNFARMIHKFLNKQGYVMVAMYGCNFFAGSKRLFNIVDSGLADIWMTTVSLSYCLLLAKSTVAFIVVIASMAILERAENLCNIYFPLAITSAFSFTIAHNFLQIFTIGADAMYVCFCIDRNENGDNISNYYMRPNLLEFVDVKNAPQKNTTPAPLRKKRQRVEVPSDAGSQATY